MFSNIVANLRMLLKKSKLGAAGFIIVSFFVFVAIFGPYLAPYDPFAPLFEKRFHPPSLEHLLGTDDVGRDVLSQILYGARASVVIGIAAALFAGFVGMIVGLIAGFYGGILDDVLMRLTDVFLILPLIPLAILIITFSGPTMWSIVLLFGIFAWPTTARQVRSQVLSLKEQPFIEAVRALGASSPRIMFIHLLPNLVGVIMANLIINTVFAVLMESGLSFLGLTDPRNITWGAILYYALRSYALLYGAWWLVLFPGACIAILCCGFSFLSHGINVIFIPHLEKAR